MYIFVLALFLSAPPQPETLVRFIGSYNTQAECQKDLENIRMQVDERVRKDFTCLQIVDPKKVQSL